MFELDCILSHSLSLSLSLSLLFSIPCWLVLVNFYSYKSDMTLLALAESSLLIESDSMLFNVAKDVLNLIKVTRQYSLDIINSK